MQPAVGSATNHVSREMGGIGCRGGMKRDMLYSGGLLHLPLSSSGLFMPIFTGSLLLVTLHPSILVLAPPLHSGSDATAKTTDPRSPSQHGQLPSLPS